jgi:predicted AAA+ superfamily ATPase
MAKPASDLAENARLVHLNAQAIGLSRLAKKEGGEYPKKRFVHSRIMKYLEGRIFIALVGPRGAGKSVLLKQIHHFSSNSVYISLDSGAGFKLFEIALELSQLGVRLLLLDEIHYYPDYGRELKKIYDFVPNIKIVFTSSSAISLFDASYDLSRRVRLVNVPPLSFREYLWFAHSQAFQPLPWKSLLDTPYCRKYYGLTLHDEIHFIPYLNGRNYPFSIDEPEPLPVFQNTLDIILTKDLLHTSRMALEEIQELRRMLEFIGRSQVDGMSYSSISQNVGITKYKAQKYVDVMEKCFVLRRVAPKGTNVTKEPKILFTPPYRLLYRQYDECVGALREDFFADAMSGRPGFSYLKGSAGEKTPDYVVDSLICEIGGRNKGRRQFKGFSGKKKIIFTQPGTLDELRRPLFFAGMLE